MDIRLLTISDYSAAHALWLSCKGMGLNDVDDSEEGIARFLRRNPSTCFAAMEGERLAGVILCGHDGRRGYIYHTAVHPDFRRRGIASALVESALEALRQEGISKTALVVFSRNGEGEAFWEARGFFQREDLTYRNRSLREIKRMDT